MVLSAFIKKMAKTLTNESDRNISMIQLPGSIVNMKLLTIASLSAKMEVGYFVQTLESALLKLRNKVAIAVAATMGCTVNILL